MQGRKQKPLNLSRLSVAIWAASILLAGFGILFSYATPTAQAAVPTYINYQSRLRNYPSLSPVTTAKSIQFSIYNDSSAGSPSDAAADHYTAGDTGLLWKETHTITPDAQGYFSVQLGSVTPFPSYLKFNKDPVYLGVKVAANSEASPRAQIGASPYAFSVGTFATDGSNGLRGEKTGIATVGAQGKNSSQLLLQGSGWTGAAASDLEIKLQNTVTNSSTYRFSILNNADAELLSVNQAGLLSVAAGQGIDTITAGALTIGDATATSVSICNSAACDTISIGTNTDADAINIGDSSSTDTVKIYTADGGLIDLSAINVSGTGEGLKLPQATSCASGTAEGQICWDTDDNHLYVGDGAAPKLIDGGSSITGADTQVLFFDGINNPAGDAGMTYNKVTDTLTLAGGLVLGSPLDVSGQATNVAIKDNAASALTIKQGANTYFDITTTDGTEALTIDLPAGGGTSLTANLFTSNIAKTINLGTGTAADTIHIGEGGTNANTITIGSDAVANTITIGSASSTSVSITDNNWSVSTAGAATFASETLNGDLSVAAQATNIAIKDNTASALTVKQGANTYLDITTTDNSEALTLDLPAGGVTSLTANLFTSNIAKTINLGTGSAADTIHIGEGGTNANTITIGSDAVANTITIGSASSTSVSITDNNWSVTTAGAATFASETLNGTLSVANQATNIAIKDNTASALTIKEGTNTYLDITTTDNAEALTLDLPAGGVSSLTANLFTSNIAKTINLGTGTAADTIHIGEGGTNANTITIGSDAVANTITIGSSSATSVSITDNNWSVTTAGAATFASETLNGDLSVANQATNIAIKDNTASALTIKQSTNTYFGITTTDNTESLTLDLPTGGGTSLTANLFTSNIAKTINLGTGTAADTIHIGEGGTNANTITIGTDAVANTITIGSSSSTSVSITDNNWSVSTAGAAVFVGVDSGAGLLQGTGGLTVTGTVSINDNASTNTTSIGGGTTTGTVSIASGSGASQILNLAGGTTAVKSVNIGTGGTGAKTITVGDGASTGTTTIKSGSGGILINDGINNNTSINTGSSTGTVTIGGTGVMTIAIGNGGTGAKAINIGDGASTGTTTIKSGSGGILLNDGVNNNTSINTGSSTGTVTIGGTGVMTISIGNGGTGAKAINIGDGASTGTTTIKSGSGGLILNGSVNNNTSINTGTSTGTVTIGNSLAGAILLSTGSTFGVTTTTSAQTYTSATTTGTTTSSSFVFTNSAITSGTAMYITSNHITTGELLGIADSNNTWTGNGTTNGLIDISSSSTAGTASASSILFKLTRSGANANTAHTAYGLYATVTNTNGTSGTNIGGYFSASGATTANYGLIVENGLVGFTTTAPASILEVGNAVAIASNPSGNGTTGTDGLIVDGVTGGATSYATGTVNGGNGGSGKWYTGIGGAASGALANAAVTTGGQGGALTFTIGNGGSNSGTIGGGTGSNGRISGGLGGAFILTAGAGGDKTGTMAPPAFTAATGAGGAGGAITITSGAGGAATGTLTGASGPPVANNAGQSGIVTISTGTGGSASGAGAATTSANGGASGELRLTTGNGGAGTSTGAGVGTGGASGSIYLHPGDGGAGTNTNGIGGSVYVYGGKDGAGALSGGLYLGSDGGNSKSKVYANLVSQTTTWAVCHTNNNTGVAEELMDCNGSAGDFMELYPTDGTIETGDVVTVGTADVTTQDGDHLKQLIKTTKPYDNALIGVASRPDLAGDFNSQGHNLNATDNPYPIALVGRVKVKVASSSDPIEPGDLLTSSTEPGRAMKATQSGQVIGKALEAWSPDSGQDTVMIFVTTAYADPNNSSERYKMNINGLSYGLDQIMRLRPVSFDWKNTGASDIGFIAEEVNQVNPGLTFKNAKGEVDGVQYKLISVLLTKAVQEQQLQIENLSSLVGINMAQARAKDLTAGSVHVVDQVVDGNLTVQGQAAFSGDNVGQAQILAGDDHVVVTFSNEYAEQPIVTATPEGENALAMDFRYAVVKAQSKSFQIQLNHPVGADVTFNWHSFAAHAAKVFISNGTTQGIHLVVNATPEEGTVTPPAGDTTAGSGSGPTDTSTPTDSTDTSAPADNSTDTGTVTVVDDTPADAASTSTSDTSTSGTSSDTAPPADSGSSQ